MFKQFIKNFACICGKNSLDYAHFRGYGGFSVCYMYGQNELLFRDFALNYRDNNKIKKGKY